MFAVTTDHQVIPFGDDAMGLYETGAINAPLVTATRTGGVWTVHSDGIDDVTTGDRSSAITALMDHALLLPGAKPGYSTMVPHGLRDQP